MGKLEDYLDFLPLTREDIEKLHKLNITSGKSNRDRYIMINELYSRNIIHLIGKRLLFVSILYLLVVADSFVFADQVYLSRETGIPIEVHSKSYPSYESDLTSNHKSSS